MSNESIFIEKAYQVILPSYIHIRFNETMEGKTNNLNVFHRFVINLFQDADPDDIIADFTKDGNYPLCLDLLTLIIDILFLKM